MKALIPTLMIACALATPVLANAQSTDRTDSTNGPETRAEVRSDLVRIEQAGYNPGRKDPYYPADIQAAEAKVAAEQSSPATAAVGGVAMNGMSQSGSPDMQPAARSIYFGH